MMSPLGRRPDNQLAKPLRAAAAAATALAEEGELMFSIARGPEDYVGAGVLCEQCFPGTTAKAHSKVLKEPDSLANVFFDVAGEASLLVVTRDGKTIACAQLVPCVVRQEATGDPAMVGQRAFWAQYVCVDSTMRRRGLATKLMQWCEDEVKSAVATSRAENADMWLAARVDSEPAVRLYDGLGFKCFDKEPRSYHVVMRKTIDGCGETREQNNLRGRASTFDVVVGGQATPTVSWSAVVDQVAPNLLIALVGILGVTALVGPFTGTSLFTMLPATPLDTFLDLQVGLLAAFAAELLRRRFLPTVKEKADDSYSLVEELRSDPSLAAQVDRLWRITGGATASTLDSLLAVVFWQAAAALSEELYYRGLVQNGSTRLVDFLTDGNSPVAALLGLLFSTSLFALAHTQWVDVAGEQKSPDIFPVAKDSNARRLDWIIETAPFGLLFGLLFLGTSSRLLAPFVCHLALNVYWTAKDLDELRAAPRADLATIFDDVRSSGNLGVVP